MVNNERKSGVILTYLNIFLNTAVMLVYTPLILKYLGQAEYGLYSLSLSILTYLALLDFGFGNAIIVFTSKYLVNNEYKKQIKLYGTVLVSYYTISVISFFMMILFYFKVDDLFGRSMSYEEIELFKKIIIIIGFNILLSIPGSIFRSILTAYEKFKIINTISIIRTLLIPLLSILAIYLDGRVLVMVSIVTAVNIFALLTQFYFYKKYVNIKISIFDFNRDVFKKAFKYSVFVFIATVVDQVNWNFGQLIIGGYLGSKDIAVYSISILFNTTFMMLSSSISSVLLPKVSKMISNGVSNDQLTNEMIKIGRLQSFIVFLVLFGFILFGKDFIIMWAGYQYVDAYYLTLIVMIPLTIPLIQNLGLSILKAKNKFHFRAISSFIMSFVTISLSFILVKKYGYFGVAISIGITFFILNGIIMNIYYKIIGINVYRFWVEILKIMVPMFIVSIVFKFILNEYSNIYTYIFSILMFVFSICIVSFLTSINDYEKRIITSLLSK